MSLLDFYDQSPQAPTLVSDPVRLRPADFEDFDAWCCLREQSRSHLTAWEPQWRAEDMTPQAFRRQVRANWRDLRQGVSMPLFVFRRADDTLVGGMALANIRFGASRSASIGYWIGAPFIRQGYAKAALAAVLDYAFRSMDLNRVEAACQPENFASRKLLAGAGFAKEGVARGYLRINGDWRDHTLFALTRDDYERFAKTH